MCPVRQRDGWRDGDTLLGAYDAAYDAIIVEIGSLRSTEVFGIGYN